MGEAKRKQEIITFKADGPLLEAMRGITNRSEFIRAAIYAALENTCPLCKGSGILTLDQRRHWIEFTAHHALAECDDCHAMHLICEAEADKSQGAQ